MLTDFTLCRVKPSGISHLLYCLVPEPQDCKYAEICGSHIYCFHPATWKFDPKAA